jgi:excisionase family DNA binding protein
VPTKKTGATAKRAPTKKSATGRLDAPAKTPNEKGASAESVPRLAYKQHELARALGVSRWTVGDLVASGELGTIRVGSLRLIPAHEVDAYIRRHAQRAGK